MARGTGRKAYPLRRPFRWLERCESLKKVESDGADCENEWCRPVLPESRESYESRKIPGTEIEDILGVSCDLSVIDSNAEIHDNSVTVSLSVLTPSTRVNLERPMAGWCCSWIVGLSDLPGKKRKTGKPRCN